MKEKNRLRVLIPFVHPSSKVHVVLNRKHLLPLLTIFAFSAQAAFGQSQGWFRAGTGLGDTNKPRVAIADFAARADSTKSHASLFTQIVRDDVQFSGILEVPSPSFYPPQAPSLPAELKPAMWIDPPTNANFLGFGNLAESNTEVAIEAWLYDVRNPSSQAVVGKVYRGAPTDLQVRKFAHQFADEIIAKLSGGLPGIALTQIAFVSSRGGSKEIWVMDYDGSNQRQHVSQLEPEDRPDRRLRQRSRWHSPALLDEFRRHQHDETRHAGQRLRHRPGVGPQWPVACFQLAPP